MTNEPRHIRHCFRSPGDGQATFQPWRAGPGGVRPARTSLTPPETGCASLPVSTSLKGEVRGACARSAGINAILRGCKPSFINEASPAQSSPCLPHGGVSRRVHGRRAPGCQCIDRRAAHKADARAERGRAAPVGGRGRLWHRHAQRTPEARFNQLRRLGAAGRAAARLPAQRRQGHPRRQPGWRRAVLRLFRDARIRQELAEPGRNAAGA